MVLRKKEFYFHIIGNSEVVEWVWFSDSISHEGFTQNWMYPIDSFPHNQKMAAGEIKATCFFLFFFSLNGVEKEGERVRR